MDWNKDKIKHFFGVDRERPVNNRGQPERRVISVTEKEIKKEPVQQKKDTKTERVDYERKFLSEFKKLAYTRSSHTVWDDFVIITACSFSNAVDKTHFEQREKMYMDIIQKYSKEERDAFAILLADLTLALEENPNQDFLGNIYMELDLGNRTNGQFFTPYHVSELMSKITLDDIRKAVKEQGVITIHDPCCGAGVMLIAAINNAREILGEDNLNFQNHILVVGQDIDMVAALMCYIQISLLGVAGYVKVGNALTEPMLTDDITENYWFTPMYFSDIWVYRRMLRKIDEMMKGESKDGTK